MKKLMVLLVMVAFGVDVQAHVSSVPHCEKGELNGNWTTYNVRGSAALPDGADVSLIYDEDEEVYIVIITKSQWSVVTNPVVPVCDSRNDPYTVLKVLVRKAGEADKNLCITKVKLIDDLLTRPGSGRPELAQISINEGPAGGDCPTLPIFNAGHTHAD